MLVIFSSSELIISIENCKKFHYIIYHAFLYVILRESYPIFIETLTLINHIVSI